MADYNIVVGIDGTQAVAGETRVVRSLEKIKKAAQETQDALGKATGRMFNSADVLRAQRGVADFLNSQRRAAEEIERALGRQEQAARRAADSFRAYNAAQRAAMSNNLDRLFGNTSSTGQQQRNIDFYTKQAAAAERANQSLIRSNAQLEQSFGGVQRLALRTAVVLQGLTAAFGFREILQANIEYQKIEFTLRGVTGSSTAAAQELDYVRKAANALGVDLRTAADGYTKLLAATQNTNFSQKETRNLFLAISEASRAFGLTIADTEGVFRAFQQILSKGTLSAEEIRQQLGDRLPGAFQIFAQAAGMSEQALTKALEAGSITGQKLFDVVNQVAVIMRERAAPAMAEASRGMQAELARLSTAWFEAAKAVGEGGFNKAVTEAAKGMRSFLDGMRDSGGLAAIGDTLLTLSRNIDLIAIAIGALVARALQPMIVSAAAAVWQFGALTVATTSFTTAANAAASASLLLQRAWAALAANPVVAVLAGLATVYGLVSAAQGALQSSTVDLSQKQEEHRATLERVRDITEQLNGASGERAQSLRIEREALISKAEAEVRAAGAAVEALNVQNAMADPESAFGSNMSNRYQNAMKAYQQAEKALRRLKTAALDSGEAWEAAFGGHAETRRYMQNSIELVERLEKRIDKVGVAQRRYNEDLKALNSVRGVIGEDRYHKILALITKELEDATKTTPKLTAAQKDLNSQFKEAVSASEAARKGMAAFFDKTEEAALGPAAKLLADYNDKLDALKDGYLRVQSALNQVKPGTREYIELSREATLVQLRLIDAEGRREEVLAAAHAMLEKSVVELEREAEANEAGAESLRQYNEQKQLDALYRKIQTEALQVYQQELGNTVEAEQKAAALAQRAVDAQRKIFAGQDASRNFDEMVKKMERSFDRIVDYGADALDELFSTGRVDDFGKNLVRVMRQAFAQILADAILRPILEPVGAAISKSLAASFSSFWANDGQQKPGGGWSDQDRAIAAEYGVALPPTGNSVPTSGFANFNSLAAGAVIAGSALPGIANRNGGQAAFGLGGAAIGTYFGGPAGGAIGGMIGNVVGSLLFKKKPSVGPGQAADFLTFDDGSIEARSFAQDNGGSVQVAKQYGRDVIKGLETLFKDLGGASFAAGTTFGVGSNQKDRFGFSLFQPGGEKIGEQKGFETLGDTIANLFLNALSSGLVEGLGENFQKAFDTVGAESADELADILTRVKQYEEAIKPALDMLDPANSGLGQALKASADAFDALIESATELGLAIDPLSAKAAEAAQAIRDGFVKGLEQQAREATGRGYIDTLLGYESAVQADQLSNLQFAANPELMAYNQGLINTRFAGQVGSALQGMSVEQLQDVVTSFGESTTSTGIYITALAEHLIALGEAANGLTDAGRRLIEELDIRELRLSGGDDRVILQKEAMFNKERELAAAKAEGFNAEQLARLAAVIDGELNKALADFDAALVQAAEAAAEAARQVEAEALAKARASRDFDADLTIREARLGGKDRDALVLELAAQKTASIEAAEAAGRTAEQIFRLAAVLDGEAAQALAEFDEQVSEIPATVDQATDALRRFNEDLAVRASALGTDELATALLRFDLDAQRQREEAAKIAGADLAALETVLAGERLKIIEDYNKRIADEQARAAEAALREQERVAEEQRRLQEEAARAAEEAAQRIAEAMKRAAELNDSLEVRYLRAQGLDQEAQILEKIKSNAQEWRDALELVQQGGSVDLDLLKKVLALELDNIVNGVNTGASGQRGYGYDPVNYDKFFTVAASGYLQNANENFRDSDLLRNQRVVDIGTSNVLLSGAGGTSGVGGNTDPTGLDDIRPLTSISISDYRDIFQPDLHDTAENTAVLHESLTAQQAQLAELRQVNEHLAAIRESNTRIVVLTNNGNKDRKRQRPTLPVSGNVNSGFTYRAAS